ncbi:MAG: Fic family protein [Caldilineaceae bacterium SB0661_bin_34]|nr:Fic family protein [Caldilineaceae bacterium SB0661_bin_34]
MGHAWKAIEPLAKRDLEYDFTFLNGWRDRWVAFRHWAEWRNLYAHSALRLERLWAIETGVIERLYTLNRGTITTLLDRGFVPDIIEARHTNIDPALLLDILRDHEASIELVHGYIREDRALLPHMMRELHACITAHQDTHRAVDSLGRHVDRRLAKGDFKKYPNNPTRPDGLVHQYAPPEQVDSEIANLVRWYEVHEATAHPVLTAAWLHHRFAQIHPFADGNGRTGRALMNWHLMKHGYLPIAVMDSDRTATVLGCQL